MNREKIEELMMKIYSSNEAAEYLGISVQRLHKKVQEGRIKPIKANKSYTLFYKDDLDEICVKNVIGTNNDNELKLDIDNSHIRNAILYFTIQQYFNYNDKKTIAFIKNLEVDNNFSFDDKLKTNMDILSKNLNIDVGDFYKKYTFVKNSFKDLSEDVIVVSLKDFEYPELLRDIENAPPYIFLKGNVELLKEKSVSIVGSRNASQESIEKTTRLVKSLVKRNIVVNAGLAKGIDTATHTAALKYGGKTIAVIGTPINQYYPKENINLQKEIEENGLVVSQFPPCNSVNRWNFPTRNATMSGISLATIIMEAGETSGALIQARCALKQKREVLIPNSLLSNSFIKWPTQFVKKGAKTFNDLKDVLTILGKKDLFSNDLFLKDRNGVIINVEMDD